MVTNSPKNNSRKGAVKRRSQTQIKSGYWVKRDTKTGKFIEQKPVVKNLLKACGKKNKEIICQYIVTTHD